MLQFTRLRLNGFKSFVDPTDLVIAPGLTGVVGPNGCGKSNLLEALRWVMGENRPTAMRGGGMEDVIFAGAASRPARNFAEVTLQIDNTDRLAPSGFNDTDAVEIVRRITRDAGSAYKANTRDVRARDVQMLFADASTGAHSPALVRQGQISELINAKPKARRRILEEAAGISGLYQRRHEAELKLNGAEANLSRVDDVLEQLASQLAQLARQAKQAARYRAIGTDLRRAEALLLIRRWQVAQEVALAAQGKLREAVTQAAEAERGALHAGKSRDAADEALPPLREESAIAGAVLQRLAVEISSLTEEEERAKSRITDLETRIAQLHTDARREVELSSDADETITRLEAEADRLAEAQEGHEEALAEARGRSEATARQLQTIETRLSERTEDVARLAAQHQSAERLVGDLERTLERYQQEATASEAQAEASRSQLADLDKAAETARTESAEAATAAQAAEAALLAADEARTQAASVEAETRAAKAAAEGEAQALRAEVGALRKLIERDRGTQDQMIDRLRVAPGFERALGAALADDLRAPAEAAEGGSGWRGLAPYPAAQGLPDGASPLADHVTAPDVLARRLGEIGLVEEADADRLQSLLQPGQRLVSREGGLWRWDGFKLAADDASSTAALRLEQVNALSALETDLQDVEARVSETSEAHEAAARSLNDATAADSAAREARRAADKRAADLSRAASRAENDRDAARTRLEAAELALARHRSDAETASEDLGNARAAQDDLPDLEAARQSASALQAEVQTERQALVAARSAFDELRRAGEGRARRATAVDKELKTWRERQATAQSRTSDLDSRRTAAEAELEEAQGAPAQLEAQRDKLMDGKEAAETRRRAADDALADGETALREAENAAREAERAASAAREQRAADEARLQAAEEALAETVARIEEAHEATPEQLVEKHHDGQELPHPEQLEMDIAKLRRSRDALGAVNLRAEEDARTVQEEHDTLAQEKADLEEAIKTLRSGIASLNKEGRERLITAFEQVNTNFRVLFTHLFGGGEARLVLVESEDPLEAGLEILCMPPGKKLSNLSLLSGGEQTLTALALIFAVFLANPAPICVLDEVDAPLDDANVTRFCDLLDEMTRRTDTRFLIITHHAITMSRMDRLFGVTMQEQGVSQLVSVDLKKAEALVA